MRFVLMLAAIASLIPCAVSARPIRIAIIDSGIARNSALEHVTMTEYDMVGAGERAAFSTDTDHGTGVATIIASEVEAPVEIISLRVDLPGRCLSASSMPCRFDYRSVNAALVKAMELKVDIINMSLDLPFVQRSHGLLAQAAASGIKIVMAAGNHGEVSHGQGYAEAITDNFWLVGSTDWRGTKSAFSGHPPFGSNPRFVWRVGEDVRTLNRKSNPVKVWGTSYAAPHYSAELANQIAKATVQTIAVADLSVGQ